MRSINMRDNAEVLHAVLAHGQPDYWTKEEAQPWTEPMGFGMGERAGQAGAALSNRAWEYYEARVTGRLRKLLNME